MADRTLAVTAPLTLSEATPGETELGVDLSAYATQAALDAVEAASVAADGALDTRVDALETASADHETRLDAIEGASGGSIVAEVVIDGGGSAITTGIKGALVLPAALGTLTISRVDVLLDQSGSIAVDVWRGTVAEYLANTIADADSITAVAPITVTTARGAENVARTGWTDALGAGPTVLVFNVDSVATATRCAITFTLTRS